MHHPKLFSPQSLLTWLLAALFVVALGALPAQAQLILSTGKTTTVAGTGTPG